MATDKTTHAQAADTRAGMTLDELRAFLDEAGREGMPGDTVPKVQATMRGVIRKITAGGSK